MGDILRKLEAALEYQLQPLTIHLEDIISTTNNFAADKCIGKGELGDVYKGNLVLCKRHTTVALKRLKNKYWLEDCDSWKEVIMLSRYRHENIISVLGFCDENGEKILVYEYAPKRSLNMHLKNNELTWVRRLEISIGVARGLAYLHNPDGTQKRILHGNIRSSNILLDENWNAKLVDFGLIDFCDAKKNFTFIFNNVGRNWHCDRGTELLEKEADVYSLGMVLFEILCGGMHISHIHKPFIPLVRRFYEQDKLDEIVYGNIREEINPSSLEKFATIAYQCLEIESEKRPLPKEIVSALETALQYQVAPPCSKSSNISPPLCWEKTPGTVGSLWAVSDKEGNQSRAPNINITELESLFQKPAGFEKLKPEDVDLLYQDLASNCQIMVRELNIPPPEIIVTDATVMNCNNKLAADDRVYILLPPHISLHPRHGLGLLHTSGILGPAPL
ncbi:hypothetical protein L2E82_48418 [Cichorium intybus]|uniref:Uncharacterized protein n=1 Tax=Cichorium intybus TaxID=13427 RepID=A0ACB8YYC5_CICIN|nr:hypothetical protein L2E82_48418 [Cichorium intybus]